MDDSAGPGVIAVFLLSPRPHIESKQPAADIELEWVWVQGLSIPKTHIFGFSVKPYKWIRFVAGALLGAKGILCDSLDTNAVEIDYDRPLIPGDSALYYHTDPTEQERFFPLDPSLACSSSSCNASSTSSRFQTFRNNVVARDVTCVLSGTRTNLCEAAHLISHTKGNDYIEALTAARSGGSETIDHIDDIRNGILVSPTLHKLLEKQHVAFLLTPNFAMSTSDVNPGLLPDVKRWTVHDFEYVLDPTLQDSPHNQPLRVPADESQWPPRVLFDTTYASVVARYFGHEDFAAFVREHWQSRLYPGGRRNRRDIGQAELHLRRAQERADGLEEMDPLDMIFCISQIARPPPTAEHEQRLIIGQRTVEAARHTELEQKVASWLGTVT
ncbi:hypothetical protein A0H81_00088 [Grifola frondosa]|uniref:HNH nuclease domain-containing protein n=1 Tax=Grifola frondosa TaxID=5627 RepID=A0A1C7MQ60_GRIFR|nr:hypothetical protein A0H81_00088 [Grifola frondosa]